MFYKKVLRLSGLITLRKVSREIGSAKSVTADFRSFVRLATDMLLFRALRIGGFGLRNRERMITLANGLRIIYRLNRGDLQSIREVWFDEVYQLPYSANVTRIVDLGANIGLTTLYFSQRYNLTHLVAVEPNPANASLVRKNCEMNRIRAIVIEAAVGPSDAIAYFSDSVDSNLGAVSAQGREVRMVSMATICSEGDIACIDLLKMDIEGGEQALLTGSLGWLSHVQNIMAEFHPTCVDYPGLISILEANGFSYIKCGSISPNSCDTFYRRDVSRDLKDRVLTEQ
jgi:FkbM family methyltransferase